MNLGIDDIVGGRRAGPPLRVRGICHIKPSSNARSKPMAATWFELARLKEGARVRFVRSWSEGPWDRPGCTVPAGTLATIKENITLKWGGLGISVVPDDKALRHALKKSQKKSQKKSKSKKKSHGAFFIDAPDNLALLWQNYSCRCPLQIHFRQCGHRCGGIRAKSSRMA